jgi:hypothetical protein
MFPQADPRYHLFLAAVLTQQCRHVFVAIKHG